MFALANDDFFDLFERTGVDQNTTRGYGFTAEGTVLFEFDTIAVLEKKNFTGHDTELMRERCVTEEMAIFAVNGNEVFRFHKLEQELLLFLAGVAGNVDRARGIVVVDESAATEH